MEFEDGTRRNREKRRLKAEKACKDEREKDQRWVSLWMERIQLSLRIGSWLLGVWLSARESLERGYLFLFRVTLRPYTRIAAVHCLSGMSTV